MTTKTITPIRTEEDYRAAIDEIESLWEAAPGTPNFDRLDVLSTLAEKYEREHHAIAPPDIIEAIKFRMDQLGIRKRDALIEILGTRSRISELFAHKRHVSMTQAQKLHAWGIPAEVLLKRPKPEPKPEQRPAFKKQAAKTRPKRKRSGPRPAVRG